MTAGRDVADPSPRLEREAVTDAIAYILGQARAGRGGALFVVGEAGLGKTTCLGVARDRAGADVRVGLGRGNVMETSLPFGLVGQAIGALGGRDVLVPADAEQWAADVRATRFYRVLRWLESLADGPVLLALDDLHWADPDSLALLSFLCRRIAALPVAIIGTLRPWPPVAAEMASDLSHDDYAAVERLAPLSEDGARSLLATRLGGAVEEDVSASVWQLCAGNPLLVEQVAHAIAGGEQLTPLAEGTPAVGAGELLLTRFAGLSPSGLRCAEAASVLGGRFWPEVAATVAGLDEHESGLALESLWLSGLVAEQADGQLEFTHPLFCQALYDDLVPPVRARLHARAFAALSRRGDLVEAAEHAVRADLVGDAKAIAVLSQAGRTALRSGALATAAGHLGSAVRLAGDQADSDLLLSLGDAMVGGGQPVSALAVCERLGSDLPPVQRANALRMMGRAHFSMGEYDAAAARFEEAVEVAETDDPEGAAEALLEDATSSWMTVGPVRSLPLAARARELGRLAPAPLRRRTQITYTYIATQAGVPDDLAASEIAAAEIEADTSLPPSELYRGWGVLITYGAAAVLEERFAEAQRILESALDLAERSGAAGGVALLSINCANLYGRIGPLPKALVHARRAAALTDLVPAVESFAGITQAALLLQLGEVAECEQWLVAVEPRARKRGEGLALLWIWNLRGQLHFRAGRVAEACELFDRAEELSHRMGYGDPCVVPWIRHAVAARLAAGRRDDAARTVAWLEEHAPPLPCRWPRIAAATSAGMLAEFDGDYDRAAECFRAGLALHEGVTLPMEKVFTLIFYGAFLRRRGQLTDARPLLAEALSIAEANGAQWYAELAAEELSVAGGRRRAARKSTELTMQEQRVAKLAAEGYSNKEIAGLLTLSVKTIEFHLQQVYMKLGINSRRQLIAMATRGADTIFGADCKE